MENLETFLSPLIFIIGVLMTIIGFWETIKPTIEHLHEIEQSPEKFQNEISSINNSLSDIKQSLDDSKKEDQIILEKVDKLASIELTLLHDSILAIYCQAIKDNFISESSYRRVCELYALNGKSQYIDQVMHCLEELHNANKIIISEQETEHQEE